MKASFAVFWRPQYMKALIIVAAIASLATPVLAGDVKSVFTKIDLKKCKQTEKADNEAFAGAWHCKGYGGYDVFIRSGDDRDSVAFGKSDAVSYTHLTLPTIYS